MLQATLFDIYLISPYQLFHSCSRMFFFVVFEGVSLMIQHNHLGEKNEAVKPQLVNFIFPDYEMTQSIKTL